MLAVCKEQVQQERELQEKYHDSMFSLVEKVMRTSQSDQIKTLRVLLERQKADVMRKIQAMRHGEVSSRLLVKPLNTYYGNNKLLLAFVTVQVKQLAKDHKDKAELDRMKREVAKVSIEKGVNECTRLTQTYEKKRLELERQHEEVRQRLDEEKQKVH